jgi:hypothetical protein
LRHLLEQQGGTLIRVRRRDTESAGDSVDGQGRIDVRRSGRNAWRVREIQLVDDFAGRRAAVLDGGWVAGDG